MFEQLYAALPDAKAYLERIGFEGTEMKADLESLDKAIYAHLHHVAFENLDTWSRGISPDMGIEYLFDKIVTRRRGGWCFELNSLFHAFLKAVGFDCYMVISHVMTNRDEIHPPAHCSIVVVLDGEKYFCDVGFGGSVPKGALKFSGESRLGFHLEREGAYTKLYNEEQDTVALQFKDIPALPVELVPLNYYISQLRTSPFRNMLHVNIRYPDGSASLVENEFKLRRGGEKLDRQLELSEIPEVLEKYFFICSENVHFRPMGPLDK